MGNVSEKIWAYLADHPGADSRAIAAAAGEEVDKVQRRLSKAVKRGHVVSTGPAGQRTYVLLRRPAKYAATPEESRAKRKEWKRMWEGTHRAKQPKPARVERAVKPCKPTPVRRAGRPSPAQPAMMNVSADVAAWMAAGGRVQRLGRYETSRPFKRIGVAA